ncbi:acetylornithine/succinyldiaminopimelate/putrescine aminotransferase [Streptomyces aurantiacus]|uniref:aspartate aminotransferase family protein n=1 Tax=Streptomyces aurantiacus TaxID=47760 RepID=UPI0027912C1E|nr:aminotransferase class III-fold pyridoxal phosphate-dependent enzyme [Streptomyces aurantiacus]MDQ0779955.1 acetylornithine/succinyldiaminopimelate/putrescine aminotransferase [Streptomyces aurantiacus]
MEELAERYLGRALSAWGLDVEYTHATGDTMYMTGEDGEQTPVTDFVGGFGSLFFGHNHPELVTLAKDLLDAGTPSHAQLSRRAEAQRVAHRLDAIARRELGTDEPYEVVFANSGAEAVEAAMKHAEIARVLKVEALGAELAAHAGEIAGRAGQESLRLSPEAIELAGPDGEVAELLRTVGRRNEIALGRAPEFIALEGGFHGKLVGSLQLTHNPIFRLPFRALGAHVRFVPVDQPEEALKYAQTEQPYALDPVVEDDVVHIRRRAVPFVAGFFVEPVQGEGGVNALTRTQAERITEVSRALDCPLVVDEIQTGAGRTGAFFAGAAIGLVGDYCTLAKSVGGGLAKTSLLLVRSSAYVKEFELLHSSTYAKDSFSCAVTEKVLEMLERHDGAAYRQAAERGARLHRVLEEVRAEFPDVVRSVRGRGLLAGFEFADQSGASSPVIRAYARGGFFGFAVSGFLLRRHGLRLLPTGSAPHTLRIQPSYAISDEAVDRLAAGLREVCALLRHQDTLHLVHALTGGCGPLPRQEVRDFRARSEAPADAEPPAGAIAYVSELGTPDALRRFEPALDGLDDTVLRSFVSRSAPVRALVPCPPVRHRTATGAEVEVTVYPLLLDAERAPRDGSPAADVARQVAAARAAGHTHVVISPALRRLTGADGGTSAADRAGAVRAPGGFELPGGFGVDGDPALLPAGLAAVLEP